MVGLGVRGCLMGLGRGENGDRIFGPEFVLSISVKSQKALWI